MFAAAACMAAIAIPAAGASAASEHAKAAAAKACAGDKKADKAAFKALYGKHAMRDCIKATTPSLKPEVRNAAQECRAERDANPAGFAATYGSNTPSEYGHGLGKNAFGKCVSSKVRDDVAEEVEAFESAADTCREQRSADAAAFMEQWGTNAPRGENSRGAKKNAFGKCVSATAKELHEEDAPTA
jgi:hypothetical protein